VGQLGLKQEGGKCTSGEVLGLRQARHYADRSPNSDSENSITAQLWHQAPHFVFNHMPALSVNAVLAHTRNPPVAGS
jgi:hypothetical protein